MSQPENLKETPELLTLDWDKIAIPLNPENDEWERVTLLLQIPPLKTLKRELKPQMFVEMSQRYGIDMYSLINWQRRTVQQTRIYHWFIPVNGKYIWCFPSHDRDIVRHLMSDGASDQKSELENIGITHFGNVLEEFFDNNKFARKVKLDHNGNRVGNINKVFELKLNMGDQLDFNVDELQFRVTVLEDDAPQLALFRANGIFHPEEERSIAPDVFKQIGIRFLRRNPDLAKQLTLSGEKHYSRYLIDIFEENEETDDVTKIIDILPCPIVELAIKK